MSAPDCSLLNTTTFNAWKETPVVAKRTQTAVSSDLTTADLTALRAEYNRVKGVYDRCNEYYGATPATTLQNTLNAIQTKRVEIEQVQERTEIAKDRVEYLGGSKRPVSYYEGWFTIGRPLQPYMLHVLMGFAFFNIVLTLYFFALSAGVSISIVAPTGGAPNPYIAYLRSFGLPFWVLLIVSVTTVTYLARRVYGKP
jgi:hypothetical protein